MEKTELTGESRGREEMVIKIWKASMMDGIEKAKAGGMDGEERAYKERVTGRK